MEDDDVAEKLKELIARTMTLKLNLVTINLKLTNSRVAIELSIITFNGVLYVVERGVILNYVLLCDNWECRVLNRLKKNNSVIESTS